MSRHTRQHDNYLYNRTRTRHLHTSKFKLQLTFMSCMLGLLSLIVWYMK